MDNLYLSNDEQKEMLKAGKFVRISYIENDVYCVSLIKSDLTLDEIKKQYEKICNVRVCGVDIATMDYYRPNCFGTAVLLM